MLLGAVGDTGYNIILFLHILTAMAAMAPAFVHPLIHTQSSGLDGPGREGVRGFIAKNSQRVYAPALILTGLFGFGLSGMSDSLYELSQGWLIAAIIVWIAMNGVLHAVQIPAERAVAEGDTSAESKVAAGGMVLTVLLLVMLYLMVWKPGF